VATSALASMKGLLGSATTAGYLVDMELVSGRRGAACQGLDTALLKRDPKSKEPD
jgi:hypothetical protein